MALAASLAGACSSSSMHARDAADSETAADTGAPRRLLDCDQQRDHLRSAVGDARRPARTVTSWSSANDMTEVLMSASFGTPFYTTYSFLFPGKPSTTTYTDATAGLSCGSPSATPA